MFTFRNIIYLCLSLSFVTRGPRRVQRTVSATTSNLDNEFNCKQSRFASHQIEDDRRDRGIEWWSFVGVEWDVFVEIIVSGQTPSKIYLKSVETLPYPFRTSIGTFRKFLQGFQTISTALVIFYRAQCDSQLLHCTSDHHNNRSSVRSARLISYLLQRANVMRTAQRGVLMECQEGTPQQSFATVHRVLVIVNPSQET